MQAGKSSGARNKRSGNRHHTHPVAGTARAEAIDIRMGVFRQPAMQTPVLVLNASYEPINICGARRALVLVLKGVARTEEEQGAVLHSHRMNLQMPSVIRLLEYRRIPHQTRALSRKNILLRDRNTCQYCQTVLIASELTLDHVVPRCRGGLSTWENLVACCRDCNRRKGSQMLHELTDMRLVREPRPFSLHTSRHIMRMIGSADANWRKYLYFESEPAA
jgi:5-methylcytosine-specific restriction endonuclease McrA